MQKHLQLLKYEDFYAFLPLAYGNLTNSQTHVTIIWFLGQRVKNKTSEDLGFLWVNSVTVTVRTCRAL